MKFLTAVLSIFLVLCSYVAYNQDATRAHKDSLDRVVQQYYQLSLKIYQKDSQVKDINSLFDLFTNDFEYVHPKYGGTYSRKDLYDGYVRNQMNGAYDGSIVDVKVRNKIIGLNGLATDRVYIKQTPDGKRIEVDPGMTLFEFRDGKISRIVEYW